jgi:hypothetical protein
MQLTSTEILGMQGTTRRKTKAKGGSGIAYLETRLFTLYHGDCCSSNGE